MDAKHFDHLTRTLSTAGSRRGLLHVLAGLPFLGWLAFVVGDDESAAKRRKSRGKADSKKNNRSKVGADNHKYEHRRRKHNMRHRRQNKKPCKPTSTAETCDGKCGSVRNNCNLQKPVDCGSCVCEPACAACQSCNAASGHCQPDPAQAGDVCGDGLVCQDGRCACQGTSCGGCRVCDDDQCVPDTSIVCEPLDQCHAAGVCDPETGQCTNPELPRGTRCDGGVCREGNCVPCGGAIDDVCCRDVANELFCYGTLECAFFGQCVESCGGLNEFCCPDAACDGSLICAFFGECIPSCGRETEFCCHNAEQGYHCDASLECSYFTECIAACGGDGEFCCLFGECDDGLTCDVAARCRPNG